jgi:wyosine [tRNA(Phe)-imidazoG37] synthetase (radical SAM superfamily)
VTPQSGTNAENIINILKKRIQHIAVFTNNLMQGVINRVQKYDVPIEIFTNNCLNQEYYKKINVPINFLAGFTQFLLVL